MMTQYGIKLTITAPIIGTPTGKVQNIMDEAEILQTEICEKADSIKITRAPRVETACGVKKPHFLKNVQVIAKKRKGSKIDNDIENFLNESTSVEMIAKRFSAI
jgi:hypothetical protein